MANKQFNVRQIQKHDTEANWDLTDGFIPLDGELIVYDKDATHDKPRIKIGDGVTDVKNLPFSGGGSQLPDVTAVNNGDVLTVVDGAWDNVAVIFEVGISAALNMQTGSFDWTFDKTYYEITGAHVSGKVVRACITIEGTSATLFATTYSIATSAVTFSTVALFNNNVVYAQAGIYSDGTTFGMIVPLQIAQD